MSADETLGLVYVPTGNSTPDYWGGHRSPESNKYASSVVALDAATGAPRWNFQTTHYDVWDYDVASQPVLFDLKTPKGVVPALLQPSLRGQLFVLDRRTGVALLAVVEKPAPQAGAVEKLAPTQPWSTALPNLGGPPLTESRMWGVTALDQLWCRIKYREARYDGSFTPPGLSYSIQDPGYIGGVNWGSATIDNGRQLAFVVSNRIVNYIRLVKRDDPAAKGLKPDPSSNLGGLVPQQGTPFAADIKPFLSPLGVPCQQPPHGLINAIDLTSGKMVWSRPLGTARDLGPWRIPSHLPFTIGTPTFGGAMSTAGGLVFAGASQDHAFRAFDSATGKLVFEADLPGVSATRPMTFLSGEDGRQYVVVASEAPPKGGAPYGALTAFVLAKD
jgi:quinoprotein glucose dehydrogenase